MVCSCCPGRRAGSAVSAVNAVRAMSHSITGSAECRVSRAVRSSCSQTIESVMSVGWEEGAVLVVHCSPVNGSGVGPSDQSS